MKYTKEMFHEFDKLADDQTSRHNLVRIQSRVRMRAFIKKHGREVCDVMWADAEEGKNNGS